MIAKTGRLPPTIMRDWLTDSEVELTHQVRDHLYREYDNMVRWHGTRVAFAGLLKAQRLIDEDRAKLIMAEARDNATRRSQKTKSD